MNIHKSAKRGHCTVSLSNYPKFAEGKCFLCSVQGEKITFSSTLKLPAQHIICLIKMKTVCLVRLWL